MENNYLIIIPCFNEAQRIDSKAFEEFLENDASRNIHFLFVDDGSSDNSYKVLSELAAKEERIDCLSLPKNKGKAEAIRAGVLATEIEAFSHIGYFDADLATPLSEIYRFIELIKGPESPIMILGSRMKILGINRIKRKITRHYIGRVFATIVSRMLKLAIYDTQCGAKLIEAKHAKMIFQEPFSSKWLFDIELLFRLKKIETEIERKIVEMPVSSWDDKSGSKMKLSYFLWAPFDLFRIYLRYR